MAHDVFISYSNKDKTIADAVCSKLEDQKIRAWIAPRDVPPGMDFAESIIDAIDACKAFVLIWSEDSNKSGHILNEVNRAFSRDITVIPFRIDNVQPTKSLEYYIGRTHWLDAMTPPLEKHIETLLDTILNLLGRKKEIKHIVAPEKEIVKKETPVTEGLKDEKEIIAPQKKLPVGLFIGAFIVMAIISVFVLTNQNQSRSSQIPSANAQFPTGTAKNIAPPPTETAKESGDIIKEAGGWPLVLSDSFDSKEQSIANGWMAGPWDDKNGFGDWMILPFADKGVYRLEVTSNSENYYSLSELPITYDQNFYLSVDVKHVSGPEDAAVGVYCKTEGEFYAFEVQPSGAARFSTQTSGTKLLQATSYRLGENNSIIMIGQGTHFFIFVNEEKVVDTDVLVRKQGWIGLLSHLAKKGDQGIFEYDNVIYRATVSGTIQLSEKDGMTQQFVPAGDFTMGSDAGNENERPAHNVYLDGFWIDQTEVTNARYRVCVEAGVCEKPKGKNYDNSDYLHHPVTDVSWNDANEYCAWAGRRLPTEAEWEKAAHGTDGRKFPWGDEFNGAFLNFGDKNGLEARDLNWDDGYADTAPVGTYLQGASPYGALDMVGNVWEWVYDWFGANYYSQSPQSNPTGPSNGVNGIVRGGSFGDSVEKTNTTYRLLLPNHAFADYAVGFRCAQSATQ